MDVPTSDVVSTLTDFLFIFNYVVDSNTINYQHFPSRVLNEAVFITAAFSVQSFMISPCRIYFHAFKPVSEVFDGISRPSENT